MYSIEDMRRDSNRTLAGYELRNNNTRFQAVVEDIRENGYDYVVGSLLILAVFLLLVWALPAMLTPMTCTVDYHTGLTICQ
jgi:hypothetical protein